MNDHTIELLKKNGLTLQDLDAFLEYETKIRGGEDWEETATPAELIKLLLRFKNRGLGEEYLNERERLIEDNYTICPNNEEWAWYRHRPHGAGQAVYKQFIKDGRPDGWIWLCGECYRLRRSILMRLDAAKWLSEYYTKHGDVEKATENKQHIAEYRIQLEALSTSEA